MACEGVGLGRNALVIDLALAPRIIRGLHVAGAVVGDEAQWQSILGVAEETVVNALVIDVKDESGRVFYNSPVTTAREVGAVRPAFDIAEVVAAMDERDLYKIARIVVFEDPLVARAKVDLAVYDTATAPRSEAWPVLPRSSDPEARAYALDLGEDVCRAGFDEIPVRTTCGTRTDGLIARCSMWNRPRRTVSTPSSRFSMRRRTDFIHSAVPWLWTFLASSRRSTTMAGSVSSSACSRRQRTWSRR